MCPLAPGIFSVRMVLPAVILLFFTLGIMTPTRIDDMRTLNVVLTVVLLSVLLLTAACKPDSSARSNAEDDNSGQDEQGAIALQRVFAEVQFNKPLFMLQPPGQGDWFLVEKGGRVLRLTPGSKTRDVVLDISDRVDDGPNEAGLFSIAFHPQFSQNSALFLSYTANESTLTSRLSRFLMAADGNIDAASEQVLLQVAQPYSNHNGGHIAFGPDGHLYFGLGDGGSGGDPEGHGQNTQTLLGAMLRLSVSAQGGYSTVASNPFVGKADGKDEIFAWGLRNPWRWSFDRSTGDLWIADVGQNSWEEISRVTGPANLGWNILEGRECYRDSACNTEGLLEPVAVYENAGSNCSITGGYVYRGERIKALQGQYLFADFCSGKIAALDGSTGKAEIRWLLDSGTNIASFAEDHQGELYVLSLAGEIYKIGQR